MEKIIILYFHENNEKLLSILRLKAFTLISAAMATMIQFSIDVQFFLVSTRRASTAITKSFTVVKTTVSCRGDD